jgi:hypothetical protein
VRLHGPQSRFELTLMSRPDVEGWFGVRVAFDGPDGYWLGTSRCLRTDEVGRLADWLEAAAQNIRALARFDTMDNCIWFELVGDESRQLRVYLEGTFRPTRASSEFGEFFQEYPVTERTLRQAALSLREQLRQAISGSQDGED